MARELTERTASILDSASTWEGVCRVVRGDRRPGTTLRVGGRAFANVVDETVEAHLPGKLPRTVVAHDMADAETGEGWTRLDLSEERRVHDAVVLLRVAYLAHVGRARRRREDAYATVDLDPAVAELDLSPGVVHLVREQARA
ncbi:MAG: luciferase family protein [Halapricum sp.]